MGRDRTIGGVEALPCLRQQVLIVLTGFPIISCTTNNPPHSAATAKRLIARDSARGPLSLNQNGAETARGPHGRNAA